MEYDLGTVGTLRLPLREGVDLNNPELEVAEDFGGLPLREGVDLNIQRKLAQKMGAASPSA